MKPKLLRATSAPRQKLLFTLACVLPAGWSDAPNTPSSQMLRVVPSYAVSTWCQLPSQKLLL